MDTDTDAALADRRALLGDDALSRVARAMDLTVEWAGRATMALILAMVLLIAANVVSRYLFSISSVARQELEWHLLVPIAMVGCAYGLRHRSHVRVDVLYDLFGPLTKAWVDLVSAVAITLSCALVAWLSVGFVISAWETGEGSPDPGGLENRFIIKAAVPLGFVLLAMQGAVEAILAMKLIRARRAGDA